MQSNKFWSRKRIFVLFYVLLIAFLFSGIVFLSSKINKDMMASAYVTIEEQLELQKNVLISEFESDVETLELFALSIAKEDNIKDNFAKLIEGKEVGAKEGSIFFVDRTGQGYSPDGIYTDISSEDYFKMLEDGSTIISSLRYSSSGNSFYLITPVLNDTFLRGFIINEIPTSYLEGLLTSAFDGLLYTYIVDDLGNNIALNKNGYVILPGESLRNVLQRAEYLPAADTVASFDEILASFAEGKSGLLEISYYGNNRLGYFTPLDINSWYLVSFLPEEAVSGTVFIVEIALIAVVVALLLVLLLFALYVAKLVRENNKTKNHLIQELTSRIEVDPLTKLYIRKETENRINTYLEYTNEMQSSALLIVDIDDFKRVNTMFGEDYGDSVLRDAAQKIKKCFRESDLVGRIDRNLFIILLRNVSDMKIITMKAEKILYDLSDVTLGNTDDYLSASVGIAICPQDGRNYHDVYAKADAAMYHVKVMGKAGYAFYDNNLKHKIRKIEIKEDDGAKVVRAENANIDNLQTNILNLLYGSQDVGNAATEMLKKIAEKYQLDRCSIFEFDTKTQILGNTYEFADEKYPPINELLQNLKDEEITTFMNDLSIAGIKEFTFIKELPTNVRKFFSSQKVATAICAYFEYGTKQGFIMFAHCGLERKAWGSSYYEIVSNCAKLYAMRVKGNE